MKYDPKLDKRPPLPDRIYNKIMQHGFITGSKVLGGWIPGKSDIDICLPPIEGFGFGELLDYGWYTAEYSNHNEFRNMYFKTKNGDILNILCFYNREDWLEWRVVTNQFLRMIQASNKLKEAIQKKDARIKFFETLRFCFYGYTYK